MKMEPRKTKEEPDALNSKTEIHIQFI